MPGLTTYILESNQQQKLVYNFYRLTNATMSFNSKPIF